MNQIFILFVELPTDWFDVDGVVLPWEGGEMDQGEEGFEDGQLVVGVLQGLQEKKEDRAVVPVEKELRVVQALEDRREEYVGLVTAELVGLGGVGGQE